MATDRDDRLRRAEKAVRQGRIEPAIAEYAALVSEQPADLSSVNALGDLYVRAGRVADAIPLYLHVADTYLREGFFSKAAGFYKKVLKFAPEEEAVTLRLAEAIAQQGLTVEAKALLAGVAQARRRRGDGAGADQVLLRIAELDPKDVGARLDAARAALRAGDPAGLDRLAPVVDALRASGRTADAIALMQEAVAAVPGAAAWREQLIAALLASGRGAEARALLGEDVLRDHPVFRSRAAELALRHGTPADVDQTLRGWLAGRPEAAGEVMALAASLAGLDPARRSLAIGVAVEAAIVRGDPGGALARLRQHVATPALAIPALQRIVEACVDADLDDPLVEAQRQLGEAFVATGQLAEARLVFEELVLQDPGDAAARDRLAGVLIALGEDDPEAAIARLIALEGDDEEFDEGEAAAPAPGVPRVAAGEVDLTAALNALAEPRGGAGAALPTQPDTLEAVFDRLRHEASPRRGTEGRQLLALGRTYLAAGLIDQAIDAFRRAALDAGARAAAACALAEAYEELDDRAALVEWLERGADAQDSPEDERLGAMRRLAEVLEAGDEPDRALAVWLELATLRPDDPQAAAHVARLSGDSRRP